MNGAVDIGNGVFIAPLIDEGRVGFVWKHPGCRAWFPVWVKPDPSSTGHTLVDGDLRDLSTITIGGSLACPLQRTKGCKAHGHITRGRWEPC